MNKFFWMVLYKAVYNSIQLFSLWSECPLGRKICLLEDKSSDIKHQNAEQHNFIQKVSLKNSEIVSSCPSKEQIKEFNIQYE